MRFNYADALMPIAMAKAGTTYYLTYDQVGSLRAIADASGNVVKRIDYDSFGNIINDTNPGFQIPLGFADGLHDRDTGLVRLGFRDYDPDVGRWTAKDPVGFWGGDIDLYGYVFNNPVHLVDPLGLEVRVHSADGWGIPGFNHAFVYSTETGSGRGMAGSSGINMLGDGVTDLDSPYNIVEDLNGLSEKEFMDLIKKYPGWDEGFWPFKDCHEQLEEAFKYAGVDYPGAPNGLTDFDEWWKNLNDYLENYLKDLWTRINKQWKPVPCQ